MRQEVNRCDWDVFLREFGERNLRRPTRLEVIGRAQGDADYLLESGLPLSGVALESEGEGPPRVEIMLGVGNAKNARHMTHTVRGVRCVARGLRADGFCERLEIEGEDGALTLLRI